MTFSPRPTQNRLLNMLQATGEKTFFLQLQLVYLQEGEVLFESGQQLTYSYFPTSVVISTVFEGKHTLRLETEAIRNDGVFGLPPMMDNLFIARAVVQTAGHAYRIETSILNKEISRSHDLVQIILRYFQLRMAKIAQIAVCSRFHNIEQQLSRILLNILDYSPTNTIVITHKTIADKLNVRRESITFHLANMHRAGIVNVMRGKLVVLNRVALEKRTCECYQVVANEADRLLNCSNSQPSNGFMEHKIPIKDLEYRYAY